MPSSWIFLMNWPYWHYNTVELSQYLYTHFLRYRLSQFVVEHPVYTPVLNISGSSGTHFPVLFHCLWNTSYPRRPSSLFPFRWYPVFICLWSLPSIFLATCPYQVACLRLIFPVIVECTPRICLIWSLGDFGIWIFQQLCAWSLWLIFV